MTGIGQALSAALIQFFWQGAVVALLFWFVERLLWRAAASLRYCAGCMALSILAALPVVTTCLLYQPAPLGTGTGLVTRDWTLPLWCAGVLLFSLRPVRGLMRIRALRRKGAAPEVSLTERARALAVRMGCERAFGILICRISETPAAIGWLRPVILIPAATLAGLSVDQLETLLAHEIAHIRRHDYLVNLLQVAIETLLFYHPAVWWISSRIRFERELCCDDEVVRATGDALGYARALSTMERLRTAPMPALASSGGPLSYRILRLVGEAQPVRGLLPAFLALILALSCLTCGVRWARAQETKDRVKVEITRNEQGSITDARVVSGPEYLRPVALMMALQQPVQPHPIKLPPGHRVQSFTLPDAFAAMKSQSAVLEQFFGDEVEQAKKDLDTLNRASPGDRAQLASARAKLEMLLKQQVSLRQHEAVWKRPEMMWKVQVLRHQLEGKPAQRAQLEKELATAETALLYAENGISESYSDQNRIP